MHVPTLVIVPGPRRSAYDRAYDLYGEAANRGFDYWRAGGLFHGALQECGLVPADDEWPHAVLTSRLPSPIPDILQPAALITPRGAFLWRPIDRDEWPLFDARINRLIDQCRGGHTVVLMDGHC